MQNQHQQHIRLNDKVLIPEENLPKLTCRKGRVVELFKRPDEQMRETELRAPNGSILKWPITKLFQIEYFRYQLNKNVGENVNKNVGHNLNKNVGRECGKTETKHSNCWQNV